MRVVRRAAGFRLGTTRARMPRRWVRFRATFPRRVRGFAPGDGQRLPAMLPTGGSSPAGRTALEATPGTASGRLQRVFLVCESTQTDPDRYRGVRPALVARLWPRQRLRHAQLWHGYQD